MAVVPGGVLYTLDRPPRIQLRPSSFLSHFISSFQNTTCREVKLQVESSFSVISGKRVEVDGAELRDALNLDSLGDLG